jgi:hypothetical protein
VGGNYEKLTYYWKMHCKNMLNPPKATLSTTCSSSKNRARDAGFGPDPCVTERRFVNCLEHFYYTISTLRGWYLVLTQPIAGGPEAGGFARVSPKPWRAKG